MKKKSKHASLRRKHEFRYHDVEYVLESGIKANVRHPAYVFLEKGNVYIYVTITHSDNVKNCLVIELKRNPNHGDNSKSYWVASIKEDSKDHFGKNIQNWKIDPEDDAKIRAFFENKKR